MLLLDHILIINIFLNKQNIIFFLFSFFFCLLTKKMSRYNHKPKRSQSTCGGGGGSSSVVGGDGGRGSSSYRSNSSSIDDLFKTKNKPANDERSSRGDPNSIEGVPCPPPSFFFRDGAAAPPPSSVSTVTSSISSSSSSSSSSSLSSSLDFLDDVGDNDGRTTTASTVPREKGVGGVSGGVNKGATREKYPLLQVLQPSSASLTANKETPVEKAKRKASEREEIDKLAKKNRKKVRRCVSLCIVPFMALSLLRRMAETLF
jgi:hypothetical protein